MLVTLLFDLNSIILSLSILNACNWEERLYWPPSRERQAIPYPPPYHLPGHLSSNLPPAASQELKKVIIEIYCIKKCLLDLDPI